MATTTYELWFNDNPTWHDNSYDVLAAFPEGFTHTAQVETDHHGNVFQLTNHIESNWTENPGVTSLVGRHVRSSSVGDVIVLATAIGVNPDGSPKFRRFSIDSFGLREF